MCEATSFAHHFDCTNLMKPMPEGSDPIEYTVIKRDGNFFKIRSIFLMKKCHRCEGNIIYKKGDIYARCDKCDMANVWELTDEMRKRFNIK